MLTTTPLSTPWQPAGPNQINTTLYGNVTGRITSIAIDPADSLGNAVYLGTTGGGVWKSSNATSANPSFAPLTDTLPVFSANSGTSVIPSLSIGAVSVQPGGTGVVLAGTGDSNDASDSFYGEGILRSADNGLTWTIAQRSNDGTAGRHLFLGEGIAGFAWSTLSPQLVVAAVSQAAEGTLVGASQLGASTRGLFYSTDAGMTWQMGTIADGTSVVQSPTTDFSNYEGNAVTAVVYNPIRQKFYAAVRFHGYYESADGRTWTRLATQPGAGLTLANCPTLAGAPGAQSCPLFRGALAVQPVTGDLFALTVDVNNLDQGLWQDACAFNGSTCLSNTVAWTHPLNAAPLESNGAIPQADYNLVLAAVPTTAAGVADTVLFAGTEEIFRCSLASGCNLRNTTNATTGCAAPAKVAPAQHAIAAGNGGLIFFGNDGGLWRSTDLVAQNGPACSADDATHFQNLNGGLGSLAEITSLATHPTEADTMLAGVGVLGSASTSSASSLSPWQQLGTGESGSVAIDQTDPRNRFLQSGSGVSIFHCSNGAACTAADFTGLPQIGASQTSEDISLVNAPFLLDPALNTNLITGTCRVWRGPAMGGSLWSTSSLLSAPLSGSSSDACTATDALIRSLVAGGPVAASSIPQNAGSTVLYAGMAGTFDGGGFAGGHFYATLNAQTNSGSSVWMDRTANTVSNDPLHANLFNPGGFDLSSIFVDPHDGSGNTVYVTVMGFGFPHLYRSTDAGATWLNLSGNLPNAPANAVVVDPNDASTVYVAMDTGVYVTTEVDICATANCWSVYGTGLPNAPVTQLNVQAAVSIPGGAQAGALRAGTYGRGIWQVPLVTAGALPAAVLQVRPDSLTFASQPVGTTSSAQTVTVSNAGSAPLNLLAIVITGDFTKAGTCTAQPILPPGASCTVEVFFTPTSTGTRTGTLTITSDAGTKTVALSGNAPGPTALILTPTTLAFSSTPIGTAAVPKNITVSNTGTANATLGTASITGDFVLSANTCGSTLPPQAGCTLSITFKPTASGARSGTLTLSSDSGIHTASLTGVGTSAATDILSPTALNFPNTVATTTSSAQTVTLTNNGDIALTLIATSITSGDFTVTSLRQLALRALQLFHADLLRTPVRRSADRPAYGHRCLRHADSHSCGNGRGPAGHLSPSALAQLRSHGRRQRQHTANRDTDK
ncbi:choice-of-anchor D domain-containing protein [Terriglobus saanensis]|nr:choice-of-anchor D domain-containing protein [Terriglobus saanensis]